MEQSVHDLTRAIASGNAEAFSRFYREWFPMIYRETRTVTERDEAFCLDIVQDVSLRVIKSLKPVESEAELRQWIRLTVRSCAIDRFRRENRRRRREARRRPVRADARHAEENTERLEWLRRELRGQDEATSTLLMMRHGFGWTLERIGSVLGLNAGAVDGRIRRAVAALGRRAREDFDE